MDLAQLAHDLRPDGQERTMVCPPGANGLVIAALTAEGPLLVITATGREADELKAQLAFWAPAADVVVFPPWETLPHERLSPSADLVGARLSAADAVAGRGVDVVIAPVRAIMQPIAEEVLSAEPVSLGAGVEVDPAALAEQLVARGYDRVDLVERRGQFAVRGGIIDVFPPTLEHPVRAELWGDTVEELRTFAVTDQRSLDLLDAPVRCYPCRELMLTPDVKERAAALAHTHPSAGAELAQIADGIAVPGMESFAPLITARMVGLPQLLPPRTIPVVIEEDRVVARSEEALRTAAEFAAAAWSTASGGGETPLSVAGAVFSTWDELHDQLAVRGIRYLTALRSAAVAGVWDRGLAPVGPFPGSAEALAEVAERARSGWRVLVVAGAAGPADRLKEVLGDDDVAATRSVSGPLEPGVVQIAVGHLASGFQLADERLAVYSDRDLTRRTTSSSGLVRMPSRRRRQVDPLSLQAGDFIVHDKHGVGRYVEMIHRDVRGADREYLVVEYAPSKRGHPPDQLFIPTDQLQSVSRYVGGETPSVNKLGGADWAKAKGRARKAVREIAGELVRLYAARQSAPGYAFGPDTPWQRELEDSFEYAETVDQLACIEEVKADMEKPVPMDRLICGDVGYGKTEIALRAAFKAVQDGKQVAVLVPTTLLVQQHLQTFSERFEGFPVVVAALSRFQSDSQAKEVVRRLEAGSIDVVIGTHRLLTPNIRFADLGLVIVDEEQRFGVEHKEYLKALRANVDMLSMSATPIPRTLEMAVTGIREMSTIATPPEERLPVLTYVGPYDERQVAAAIHRELLRDGQVFFVHNRVDSIDRTAAHLAELVPEARIAVAHGQMHEAQLEQVVVDFWEGRVDVLVCTTIVESGIDIANANTLVVDRADAFGLSQLHQLRGRVGRSRARAYAYFFHSPDRTLSETAHERLSTIAQNTDLGSGMQVALKDLEIRGAGNLLGGEQSGHIAEVGFDLYVRLVGEALSEFKGEKVAEQDEVRIDLPVDAHIPSEYVPEERLRLEAYRTLAGAFTDQQIDELAEELKDRYGPMPPTVTAMIAVARFRLLAKRAGLADVILMGNRLRLHPVELPDSRRVRLTRLYPGALLKPAVRQMLVPFPEERGEPISGQVALDWAARLVKTVILDEPVAADRSTSA
jgi:transcription-repair coupling factor (superfamily II helicase)